VAADGGADAAMAAGRMPERVIGDMDSLSDAARAAFADRLMLAAEQDSTDFAKALGLSPAPWSLAVGFIGARVDHFLACLSTMAATGASAVLLSDEDCICLAPPRLELQVTAGTRVSLWPLARAEGHSRGLHWPIDGLTLEPTGRVGTSNRATGPVTLDVAGGPMAVILPAAALDAMLDGLGHARAPEMTVQPPMKAARRD
jgi:thiamine pyrophosphokinase